LSTFGGSAWTKDPEVGRYYLHNFLPEQPDLNWWNEGVRKAFEETLRFWFDRGIDGFRIDVAHALIKDAELRDNPVVGKAKDRREERVYNMNRPEVHEIYRRWRTIARDYDPERLLLGETWVSDTAELAKYYGYDDELQLPMNFPFTLAEFDATELRQIVERADDTFPAGAWPVWCASNHDIVRFPTRWCSGDESKIRCALMLLLGLRGTPILYYGDELGMEQVAIPEREQRDGAHSRDGARTPMPWTPTVDQEWWVRHGDLTRNVEDMRADETSTLWFTKRLLELRRATPELRLGSYSTLDGGPGVWGWRRGEGSAVAVNLSDHPRSVRDLSGTIHLDTGLARAGESVAGTLQLAPWEGAVVGA
jgi:alpha-glucosidase